MEFENGSSIKGYDKINVILGKNGSGKSTLLRLMDERLSRGTACVRYITPERGGLLRYDGVIETNRSVNPNYMSEMRRNNLYAQFRQSSVTEFRNLETLVLREIVGDPELRATKFKFDTEIERINGVLDRVRLVCADTAGFDILKKSDGQQVEVSDLSSGESELISLAIEILCFSYLCKNNKYSHTENWILLDEPDVHLHPDLQHRLMDLLVKATKEPNCRVAIATHSTSILSSLDALTPNIRVGLKRLNTKALEFRSVDHAMHSVLPMFGAHPLSNVFNEKPPLIVEGEDDERIWQAAVRRSQGRIAAYPCVAGDIQSLNSFENAASDLIASVYENAKAYSLRDRDDDEAEISDVGPVIRCRLACRNAENLIVSDDVLHQLGTTWKKLQIAFEKWLEDNSEHPRHATALAFRQSGWDRKMFHLKELRMVIVGITGSTKPWEVAVGQAIAQLHENRFDCEHCLKSYLGPKIIDALNLLRIA